MVSTSARLNLQLSFRSIQLQHAEIVNKLIVMSKLKLECAV